MIRRLLYAINAVRRRGVGFLWTYFRESIWFDLRHGTSTSSRVPKDEQDQSTGGAAWQDGLLYVASFTSVTRKALNIAERLLGSESLREAQFVDLGCGKGKTLLVYAMSVGRTARHPALGIEYDPALAKIAQANAAKCRFDEGAIKIVADSAVNLRAHVVPGTLVVYLYNSFQGETLRQTLHELAEMPHILIYVDPAEAGILPDFGYTIAERFQGRYNGDTWLVATRNLD